MSTTAAPLETESPVSSTPPRLAALDRLRGAAVVLMLLDHLLIVAGHGGSPLRFTVTRLAMPLFAVLAGHLVSRVGWRWAGIFVVGLLLPLAVPWIDNPNILCLLAYGALVVSLLRRYFPPGLWVAPLFALTLSANGLLPALGHSYQLEAVVGLMCLGALVPRTGLDALGSRLPSFLARFGRYPLTVYVGHLLLLQLFVYAWSFGA